jgi:hypothetical protein
MAELLKFTEGLRGEGGGGGRQEIPILDFLQMAAHVVLTDGWVSKATSQKCQGLAPTSSTAWGYCFPTPEQIRKGEIPIPSEAAKVLANDTLVFIKETPAISQYESNLKAASQLKTITHQHAGLVASMIVFFQKDLVKKIKRENKLDELRKSKHFGEIGKRSTFKVIVEGENTFDSQFAHDGLKLYRMRDMDGNVAVWWTGSGNLEVGKQYEIKATVKRHDEYQGIAQTVFSRVVVQE